MMLVETKKIPIWHQLAACRGVDAEIFYPIDEDEAEDAKSVCEVCAVREACLEWALANRERDGIWWRLNPAAPSPSRA